MALLNSSLSDSLRQAGLSIGRWLGEPDLAAIIRAAYEPSVTLDARHDPTGLRSVVHVELFR